MKKIAVQRLDLIMVSASFIISLIIKSNELSINENFVAQIEIIRKSRMVPDDEKANQWAKCMMQKHNVVSIDRWGKKNLRQK